MRSKLTLAFVFTTFLLSACTDYLDEFQDEYDETFTAVDKFSSSDDDVSSSSATDKKSSSSQKEKSSSSEKKIESSSSAKSSSSNKGSEPGEGSSSSEKVSSSSSQKTESSSSENISLYAGVFGTCAPQTLTVEKGTPVSWAFTWDKAAISGLGSTGVATASYKWTFDGDDAEIYPGTDNTKSPSVTYSKFGTRIASVEVSTTQHGSQTIECSPLIVSGSSITGCRCVPINIRPDVSTGDSAKWQISGCTSAANITGYIWTGATQSATGLEATAPVSSRGDKVTGVSVSVENDENTVVTVLCEDAKAIDSSIPDYIIDESGDKGSVEFSGSGEYTIIFDLESGWHGGDDTGECTFSCVALGEFSGTIGTVKISGSYHSSAKIPVSSTIGGNSVPFTLTTENGASATCKVQW